MAEAFEFADPTEPHWCGWPLDRAVYRSHEGECEQEPTR